ncbi:15-hydroxyprostaglandin dehydrogenase [NAD(+)]-like isoform X1 [Centruroides sculpturatus]|uniref:15-hydroxyprostaglandin dehydrogenase [NAD(+)]-like isoform X1 n=1 Tax=Centruroides sculpturatus TaxID=218467 RepID=UPI000C6DBBFD|nr:15-hydroxyprostaglandin dehydrogenase [NAD(+)]-like isoform X1 [Centruroides sculpturatus]
MKVGLVTGGAKGIGKAICNILAKNNYRVIVTDVDSKEGIATATELQDLYGKENVMFMECDISSFGQFETTIVKVVQQFGSIDVIVNNAGILDENNWQMMVDINLNGSIHGTLLGLQFMGKHKGYKGGTIINIASNAAIHPFPLAPIYSACKHGIVGLSRSYGHPIHFERTGVCILTLCPWPTNTKLCDEFVNNSSLPDVANEHMEGLKMMEPSIVAEALLHMLKDQKTGSVMKVSLEGYQYVQLLS